MLLNEHAVGLADQMLCDAESLCIEVHSVAGARVVDCGARAHGGIEAGVKLAEVCLSGLGKVGYEAGGPTISVHTDQPIAACMASQYAGWEVKVHDYFAMGSGPMRAAAAREELFVHIGHTERPDAVVGVLETDKTPTGAVCHCLADACGVATDKLTLLYAPTHSAAGNVQVVARSVETALHKLHELGFDLSRVKSGWGSAPLPPVAKDALTGIGRTNDAILYGGQVVLEVTGDDASLAEFGPRTPSNSSPDHGRPFKEVFAAYEYDFYKIDPLLFSPAQVTFKNVETGGEFTFGELAPEVLEKSFGD